jgi:hypothetical protein
LTELYSNGQAGLPRRDSSRTGLGGRHTMPQAERDRRRELHDPRFRRAQKRRRAAAQRRRDVAMHIGDRAAFRHGIQGRLTWGGRTYFSFSGNYKNSSYNPSHAQPGVRVDAQENIWLEGTGNRKPILIGPMPNRSLIKRAALGEPHPLGLFCVPVDGQDGVFACMDCRPLASDENKWVVTGFCVAGHQVPECVARGTMALADIQGEPNAEAQRIMIERFGYDRYIRESGARQIQEDEFGRLYAVPGNAVKLARLLNSTPNPDGSINEYFLPVPATMRTAHEAVAWSFGCTPETYHPAVQS